MLLRSNPKKKLQASPDRDSLHGHLTRRQGVPIYHYSVRSKLCSYVRIRKRNFKHRQTGTACTGTSLEDKASVFMFRDSADAYPVKFRGLCSYTAILRWQQ
ncbi:unnamed protein product [Gongylonema pulchrum]|uniref:Uncharacterized protein n=1 Tax=Gongylonema pulchrum TaxID=637853 RepID=A0A183E5R1_9BILA|nr:unnamed protein product [Gongylonema pulchrum]